jgi:hypothetical protein
MSLIVTLYGGWITVIPKNDSIINDRLWTSVQNFVVSMTLIVNIAFVLYVAFMFLLEITREVEEGTCLSGVIHSCHRVHGKTKSKKAKSRLKKMSSIVVPSNGRKSATKLVESKQNSLSGAEAKLLRYTRTVFPAGTPEYTNVAQLIMKMSRNEIEGDFCRKELISILSDRLDTLALINGFILAAETVHSDGGKAGTPSRGSKSSKGHPKNAFRELLQADISVADAQTMDADQRRHAADIRKRFKENMQNRGGGQEFVYSGSKQEKQKIQNSLTKVLKNKDALSILKLTGDLRTSEKALADFEAELDILDHILGEARDKAMKELADSVESPTQYARIEDALKEVSALQVPGAGEKVKEGIEAYIYGEHTFRTKQLIDKIAPSDILALKNLQSPNESVVTTIRGILLMLGTRPKDITDWSGCCSIVTQSGSSSLKSRVSQLDPKGLSKKKKTLKLIAQTIITISIDELKPHPSVVAMYGFLSGTLAESYPVYLSKKSSPEKRSTKSWGRDAAESKSDVESKENKAEKEPGKEPKKDTTVDTVPPAAPAKKSKRPSLKRKGTMML